MGDSWQGERRWNRLAGHQDLHASRVYVGTLLRSSDRLSLRPGCSLRSMRPGFRVQLTASMAELGHRTSSNCFEYHLSEEEALFCCVRDGREKRGTSQKG